MSGVMFKSLFDEFVDAEAGRTAYVARSRRLASELEEALTTIERQDITKE